MIQPPLCCVEGQPGGFFDAIQHRWTAAAREGVRGGGERVVGEGRWDGGGGGECGGVNDDAECVFGPGQGKKGRASLTKAESRESGRASGVRDILRGTGK